MPSRLQRFVGRGIKEFEFFITGDKRDESPDFLFRPTITLPVGNIEIEKRKFSSKKKFVRYISKILEDAPQSNIVNDPGLWAWLSAFYIDQVAPKDSKTGVRKYMTAYRHIPTEDWRTSIRHLLRGPFLLDRLHGEMARIFLSNKLDVGGEFVEQFGNRMELILVKSVIEAMDTIYWDNDKKTWIRGATSKIKSRSGKEIGKPGALRRYIQIVQRLMINYDLNSMDGDEVLALVQGASGDEFDRFLE